MKVPLLELDDEPELDDEIKFAEFHDHTSREHPCTSCGQPDTLTALDLRLNQVCHECSWPDTGPIPYFNMEGKRFYVSLR